MIVVATLISESVPYEEDRGREKRRDRERGLFPQGDI